jgi:hypothetical protein
LKLVEVTSFRFLSPEYDMVLQKESAMALEQAELQSNKTAAQIRAEKRTITEQDMIGATGSDSRIKKAELATEHDLRRTEIAEQEATRLRLAAQHGAVKEAMGQVQAAEAARSREMEAVKLQHTREQHLLNEQTRNRALMEKARMMLELKNLAADAQLERENKRLAAQGERRVQYLKAIADAGLSSDSILAIQLAENPHLANAYAAAVKAKSVEEKLELQKEFEEKLLQIATSDRKQVNDLLTEGIKQIGHVMGEAQKKQRPSVIVSAREKYEVISDAPPPSSTAKPENGP